MPSTTVSYPPLSSVRAARTADRSTVRFCASASGSHGSTNPVTMVVQNQSASTHTAVAECYATDAAMVDFPAPGGPVMISTSDPSGE